MGNEPVTVIARHAVRPGKEDQFEAWMAGISRACGAFPGYLGTELIRPPAGEDDHNYVCIFRFDDYPHLKKWMESEERAGWLEKAHPLCAEKIRIDQYRSLEYCFTNDKHQSDPPPKYKMALVTFAVIWPLVHFVPKTMMPVLPGPNWLKEGLTVLTIVLLTTFLLMPAFTRLLEPWLFRRKIPQKSV